MIRPTERRLKAMMIAAGALMLGGASTALGMVASADGHAGQSGLVAPRSHEVALGPVSTGGTRLATTADPFLCVAYAHTWGICIGPPTN